LYFVHIRLQRLFVDFDSIVDKTSCSAFNGAYYVHTH